MFHSQMAHVPIITRYKPTRLHIYTYVLVHDLSGNTNDDSEILISEYKSQCSSETMDLSQTTGL